MYGKRDEFFSENQRKGGNLKIFVWDRGYEMNSMDKHEVHLVVGLQVPGFNQTSNTFFETPCIDII